MAFATGGVNVGYTKEPLISKIGSLTDNRGSMVWENLAGKKLNFIEKNMEADFLDYKDEVYLTSKAAEGRIPWKVIYLEAKPVSGADEYGIKGTYVIKLPEKKTIQFQGAAQILAGKKEGAVFSFQIWAPSEKDPATYILSKEFYGDDSNDDGNDFDGFRMFILDLSAWAGQEIRIVPVLKVKPGFSNISGKESWTPNKIAVQIGNIDIIASKFSVTLSGMEEAVDFPVSSAKINHEKGLAKSKISVTTDTTEEKVIAGLPEYYLNLCQPGDCGLPSILLPNTNPAYYAPSRYISYFSSALYGQTITGTACIDFAGTSITMATATVQEVNSHIVDANSDGNADFVITPASPNTYEGINSLITSTYSSMGGSSFPILHAFVYGEKYLNDENDLYSSIFYARSYGNSSTFGTSFSKMQSVAGYPIITHPSSETDILSQNNTSGQQFFGVGGPTVYEVNGYYYLLYNTRANGLDYNNSTGTYIFQGVPGITIARALKTDVNNSLYTQYGNPWKKFKEVNTSNAFDNSNWVEPGIGGDFSFLINAALSGGKRTNQLVNRGLCLSAPRVSYNEYLALSYPQENQMIMICTGYCSLSTSVCVLLYTSPNLINWYGPYIICYDTPNQQNFRYPTIIGRNDTLVPGYSSGWDALTTRENTLYYQIFRPVNGQTNQHLFRRKLTFNTM